MCCNLPGYDICISFKNNTAQNININNDANFFKRSRIIDQGQATVLGLYRIRNKSETYVENCRQGAELRKQKLLRQTERIHFLRANDK